MAGAFRKGMGGLGAAGSLGLGAAGFAFAKMGGAPLMAAGVGAYGLARKGYSAGSGMFSGSGPSDKPKAIAHAPHARGRAIAEANPAVSCH